MSIGVPSPTLAPQSEPFSELKREVAMYVMLPDAAEPLQVAGDALNNAIRRLNERTWYWAVASKDITLVADTKTYDHNTDYKAPYRGQLLDSSGNPNGHLVYCSPKEFWARFPDATASGSPAAYTVLNPQEVLKVQLSLAPTSGYVTSHPTLRVYYYRRVQLLTSGGSKLSVPSEVVGYLKWYAKYEIATIYDPRKANMAKTERDEIRKAIILDHNEHHHTDWRTGHAV